MITFSACALACVLAGADNAVLMEFTAEWCGPCRSAQPTVQRLIADGFPVQAVDIDREPQLAAQYRVTSVPCFVLVVGGREVDRVLGAASYARLTEMFERAGKAAPTRSSQIAKSNEPPFVRAQSPDEAPRFGLPRPLASLAKGLGNRGSARRQANEDFNPVQIDTNNQQNLTANNPAAFPVNPMAANATPHVPAAANTFSGSLSGRVSSASIQQAMRATVRLRIEDGTGHSLGTGTIVDAHGNEALIVTCGHIFRESRGKGRVVVELFTDNGVRTVQGTMISYDLDRDIALVAVSPGYPTVPARVAPAGFQLTAGQPVFSIGCDKGTNPSPRESKITAIDRYVGLPNLEVAGMPVDGRSGGGLFSADGYLIGVCNAADPENQEGIFASLPIIHWELDKVGQRKIYDAQSVMLASSTPSQNRANDNIDRTRPMAETSRAPANGSREIAAVSSMPREMQGANLFTDSPAGVQPATDDTEVICIVRSRTNPQASQQLLVLDRPSRELMDRFKSEYQQRPVAEIAAHDRFNPQTPTIRAQSNDR